MNEHEHEGILAIFLSEAEEIVQRLSEQLAELHYGYDGQRILDDIHRGFHTLHGGATVLNMPELAECAQLTERVMERVRTRRVSITPSLVSLLVAAIGSLELMLARRINHQPPRPVDNELKARLLRAADRNNNEAAANNPVESSLDTMGVFFDGRLQPRDNQIASIAPSVLHYEKTRFEPLQAKQGTDVLATRQFEQGSAGNFPLDSPKGFESIDSAVATLTRESLATLSGLSDTPGTAEGDALNLVRELSWVKQRLMKFHAKGYSEELDKALTYLDLVTQDFEAWAHDRSSDGDTKPN